MKDVIGKRDYGNLLFVHTLTGCVRISALFGKACLYEVMQIDAILSSQLCMVVMNPLL